MKVKYLLAIMLSANFYIARSVEIKYKNVDTELLNAHVQVFSSGDLFTKRDDKVLANADKWYNALAHLKEFARINSIKSPKSIKPLLEKLLVTLDNSSKDLINGVKAIANSKFDSKLIKTCDSKWKKDIEDLKSGQEEVKKIISGESFEKIKKRAISQKVQQISELIEKAALIVEVTIEAAITQLGKHLKAK